MTLVNLPASPEGEGEGWHNPPHPMWFILLSGRAKVWTPGTGAVISRSNGAGDGGDDEGQHVWIDAEGTRRNQIVLALDVMGKGHKTWYYGKEGSELMALQLQLGAGGEEEVAKWEIVGEGAC